MTYLRADALLPRADELEELDDVAPPGREAQVLKLKEKPGIDNPFAVAWASYEGDSMDYDDGASGLTAGGKPGPEGDEYEQATLSNVPFKHSENMDDDDLLLDDAGEGLDLHQRKGHAVGAVHSMHGAAGGGGSDEELLDDSEVEGGEHIPHEVNAPTDPAAHGPEAHGVSDPEPKVGSLKGIKT